jgi:hypothetical protein
MEQCYMACVVNAMEAGLMTFETRLFPILVPHAIAERAVIGELQLGQQMTLVCAIPWTLIAPHEKQAKRNHRLGLEELAQRGGLDASEALAVINGHAAYGPRRVPWLEANQRLAAMLVDVPELTAA